MIFIKTEYPAKPNIRDISTSIGHAVLKHLEEIEISCSVFTLI